MANAYPNDIREEELKNKVATDYFSAFDNTKIIGNVDFCIAVPTDGNELFEQESLLWAEAKRGRTHDIYHSFVQLIITIGKAKTFDQHLPPAFLGAFDAEKIGFLPYHKVIDVFYRNDFNWNVTPSDHDTREFQQVLEVVRDVLNHETLIYRFSTDEKELRKFIKENFKVGKSKLSKIRITKNNFINIYQKWCVEVLPTIGANWEEEKQYGLIPADFYLADILSKENATFRTTLNVLLLNNYYKRMVERKRQLYQDTFFKDNQVAHTQFWNRYIRPPKQEYWDYIVERRDLLVPQDVRERKGSFFTPQIWVEKSQEYLADVLGENWQDEYVVWDCCAGTGNLLNGLSNKWNIWASTLDQADVDVMHDRVRNGANLLDSHIFQFDFLNDDFSKLPQGLQDIIADEEQRKKLVIYINPPYAEAPSATTVMGTGKNKIGVSIDNAVYTKYKTKMSKAANELFAQFFTRAFYELKGCNLASFSTLKYLNSTNFRQFRDFFKAEFKKGFIVPAKTFDNVTGDFPIGFLIWNILENCFPSKVNLDIFDVQGNYIGEKDFFNEYRQSINNWWILFHEEKEKIGLISNYPPDFQNQQRVCILSKPLARYCLDITKFNLIPYSVYFAVRHCIEHTWINHNDQFLFPNDGWKTDKEFQSNCLAFTLFYDKNRISSAQGVNHWIPFTEVEVDAKEKFASHFMTDFISGKAPQPPKGGANGDLALFETDATDNSVYDGTQPIAFSAEAQAVFDAGRELWRYYHAQEDANANASFYDIRRHFQGVKVGANGKERMNNDSKDEKYNSLIKDLRDNLKLLAKKIEPKVYEYGFLK